MEYSQAINISNFSEGFFIASPVSYIYGTGMAQYQVVPETLQFNTELLREIEELSIPGSLTTTPEETVQEPTVPTPIPSPVPTVPSSVGLPPPSHSPDQSPVPSPVPVPIVTSNYIVSDGLKKERRNLDKRRVCMLGLQLIITSFSI
jgi:hypothetical protein